MTTLTACPPCPLSVFCVDAWVSGATGLSLALFAEQLHALAGGGLSPATLTWIGVALLPWSAHNWFSSLPLVPRRRDVFVQLFGDSLWVLGSLVVLWTSFEALSSVGRMLYAGQIVGVLGVLGLKLRVASTLPQS